MGQKVHPIGLRLGRNRKWNSTWFLSNQDYTKFLHLSFSLEKFLEGVLHYSPRKALLVNFKIINYSLEKLYIFVFFYRYRRKTKINYNVNLNDNKLFKPKIKKQSTLDKQYNEYIYNQVIKNLDSFNNYELLNINIKNIRTNSNLKSELNQFQNYLNILNENINNSVSNIKKLETANLNNKVNLDILNKKKDIKKNLNDLISLTYKLIILKSILKVILTREINGSNVKTIHSEVLLINKKIKRVKSKKKIISNIIDLNVNLLNLDLNNYKLNSNINTLDNKVNSIFKNKQNALLLIKKINTYLNSVDEELKNNRQNKQIFIKLNGVKQSLLDNRLQLLTYLNNKNVYINYLENEKNKVLFKNLIKKTQLNLKLIQLNKELLNISLKVDNNLINELNLNKNITKNQLKYLNFINLLNKNNKVNYLINNTELDKTKITEFFKIFSQTNNITLTDYFKAKKLNLKKLLANNVDLQHLVNNKEFKLKNKLNLTNYQKNFVNIFLNKKQLNFKRYLTKNFDTIKKNSESISLSGNNKVKANKVYINKKLHTNVKNIKKSLIFLTKTNVSLIMINALSFTKFNYYLPEKNSLLKKNPNSLITLEQQMVKFYKYSAVYISDLVNITFISLFLKNATFLAKFIGFQLNRTPRNRKQTRLIQLINQTTKILLYQRKEIIGLRIKLKGRINGRNRGRYVYINKGVLPLQSYDSRIEYGSSKGYTRNGVIGIKIWICYDKNFNKELYNTYKQYFNYIQLTQSNKVKILNKPVKKKL